MFRDEAPQAAYGAFEPSAMFEGIVTAIEKTGGTTKEAVETAIPYLLDKYRSLAEWGCGRGT